MSVSPISWQEIQSWQETLHIHDSWLAKTIRDLSIQYVNELSLSTDPARHSPLQEHIDRNEQRTSVKEQIKNIFGATR